MRGSGAWQRSARPDGEERGITELWVWEIFEIEDKYWEWHHHTKFWGAGSWCKWFNTFDEKVPSLPTATKEEGGFLTQTTNSKHLLGLEPLHITVNRRQDTEEFTQWTVTYPSQTCSLGYSLLKEQFLKTYIIKRWGKGVRRWELRNLVGTSHHFRVRKRLKRLSWWSSALYCNVEHIHLNVLRLFKAFAGFPVRILRLVPREKTCTGPMHRVGASSNVITPLHSTLGLCRCYNVHYFLPPSE